jgi:hypothetical protein
MNAAEAIDWTRKPTQALDDSNPPFYRWFADGEANTCWNAVPHVWQRVRHAGFATSIVGSNS